MKSDCEKMKDQIADHITGILSETQVQSLELHLNECSSCREYAHALKKEDTLLTGLFAEIEMDMTNRQEQILRKVNQLCVAKKTESPSIRNIIMKNPISKLVAAAVIIVAILTGINLFEDSATSVAWGEVVRNIESSPGFIYRMKGLITFRSWDSPVHFPIPGACNPQYTGDVSGPCVNMPDLLLRRNRTNDTATCWRVVLPDCRLLSIFPPRSGMTRMIPCPREK